MDFNSIDFGLIFLKQFDTEVVIYDYTKMSPDKNKLDNEGVHLIAYIYDRYSLKLIYHQTGIHFLITDQLYRYIDKKIFYTFITRQHFTYYEDVVKFLIDFEVNIVVKEKIWFDYQKILLFFYFDPFHL